MPALSIILPVYGNREAVERCIGSLLPAALQDAELLIVDDASTDQGLAAWLHGLAEGHDAVSYLRNDRNVGFAASVNRGIEVAAGDAVILNSDTQVPQGWLERLVACAASDDRVATVTPFTNNGSICSYPLFCASSELPEGLDLDAMASLFARANAGQHLEIPTGVGFCMYITRRCIDAVGLFDAETFGAGYGEENDYCLRASAAGFRHLLCADLFVYHEGGVSFGGSRSDLMAAADRLMEGRHPAYGALVQRFIERDPVAPLRAAVDGLRREIPGQLPVLLQEAERREALLARRLADLQLLLNDYRDKSVELESLLETARASFQSADAESRRRETAYGELEESYATLTTLLEESRERAEQLEAEFRQLEERLREALQRGDTLEEQAARCGFEVVEAREQRDEQAQHLAVTTGLLETARSDLAALEAQRAALERLRVVRAHRWLARKLKRD